MSALGDEPSRIHSFTVLAQRDEAFDKTLDLATQTPALIDPRRSIGEDDIRVSGDALGEGYGIPTAGMLRAVRTLAQSEGLLLDPVYSGKAFDGLLSLLKRQSLPRSSPVLFVMTGGTPGLFAYQPAFA